MKSQSKKLAKANAKYSKLRKEFLWDKPNCQARMPGCTLKSTDIHHKLGRGKYLNDTSTWLSCCRKCHNWIELHPEESIELNFTISRHDR